MYIQIVNVNEVVPFHEPYIYTIYQTNALEKSYSSLPQNFFQQSLPAAAFVLTVCRLHLLSQKRAKMTNYRVLTLR